MGIRFSKQTHRKEIYVSDKNAGNLRMGHGESAKNSGNSRVEHDKSAKNVGNLRVELEKSAKNAGSSRVEHDKSAKNAGNLRVEHEKSAKNAGNSRVEHKQSDEAEQPLEILHNGEQQTKISVDVSVSNDDHVTVDKKLLVAAIDIGTSYSGYAYSFAHEQKEGKEDPDRICVNNWENDGGSRTYFKTPSCLLLHPNGNLNCFGYEALDRYKTLLEDGKDKDVYFFMDFKMILHQEEEILVDCRIRDENEKEIEAMTVFRYSIQYMKEHLERRLKNSIQDLHPTDIKWVITVPAIWKDSAKKFMRQAAEQAGINRCQIDIALEPESASLYCRSLKTCRTYQEINNHCPSLTNFPIGTKYMVVDCGGGTVDVTVHEVMEKNTLRELHAATGGGWGGSNVTKAFLNYISQLIGSENYHTFSTSHISDYIQLIEDFELKKRTIKPDFNGNVNMRIPSSLSKMIIGLDEEQYSGKLKIQGKQFESFFNAAIEDILKHIERIVDAVPCHIQTILLVGGFAESPVLQQAIKDRFNEIFKVIIPIDPSLCVMKGAVLYGFNPSSIEYRRSRYTYGVATSLRFRDGEHPENRKFIGKGEAFCDNIFDKHVEIDQEIPTNMAHGERIYYPITNNDKLLHISLYRSTEKNPKFVDEQGCQRVGTAEIPIDLSVGKTSRDRPIKVKIMFGTSDINVLATQNNGKTEKAVFKLNTML